MAEEPHAGPDLSRLTRPQRFEPALVVENVEHVSSFDAQNTDQLFRLVGAGDPLLNVTVQVHRHELDDAQAFGTGLSELDDVVRSQLNGLAVPLQHQNPIALHNSDAAQLRLP